MKTFFLSIFLLLGCIFTTTAQWSYTQQEQDIKQWVNELASEKYEGRGIGTEGGYLAAEYVVSCLTDMGYKPEFQEFVTENHGTGRNIIVKLDGEYTDSLVILGAHYDHLGIKDGQIYYGADDNATGTAVLMSLAKRFKESGETPKYSILFIAWDGEEQRLLGSKHFVENIEDIHKVKFYMNFDMIGRSEGLDSDTAAFAWNDNFPHLKSDFELLYEQTKNNQEVTVDIVYEPRRGDGKGGSDYAPFSKYNIPFIAWMEHHLHEDYHKPTDTVDKLEWKKMNDVSVLSYKIIQLYFQ